MLPKDSEMLEFFMLLPWWLSHGKRQTTNKAQSHHEAAQCGNVFGRRINLELRLGAVEPQASRGFDLGKLAEVFTIAT